MSRVSRAVAAAILDADAAVFEYDAARSWIRDRASTFSEPLAVEVWVFDSAYEHIVLVEHRWRGAVPPGGAVEPGEEPRAGALRELAEETGIRAELHERPAAVAVRSYKSEWPPTLGISYAAVIDLSTSTVGETDQPATWHPLHTPWTSVFDDDRDRIRRYADWALAHPSARR